MVFKPLGNRGFAYRKAWVVVVVGCLLHFSLHFILLQSTQSLRNGCQVSATQPRALGCGAFLCKDYRMLWQGHTCQNKAVGLKMLFQLAGKPLLASQFSYHHCGVDAEPAAWVYEQVGGAGLGFGAPAAVPSKPSMAGFAPAAASTSPAEAGSMQGFARSNMEANDNLSSVPSAPGSGLAPPPLPLGRPPSAAPTGLPALPPKPAQSTQAGARDEMRQMRRGEVLGRPTSLTCPVPAASGSVSAHDWHA